MQSLLIFCCLLCGDFNAINDSIYVFVVCKYRCLIGLEEAINKHTTVLGRVLCVNHYRAKNRRTYYYIRTSSVQNGRTEELAAREAVTACAVVYSKSIIVVVIKATVNNCASARVGEVCVIYIETDSVFVKHAVSKAVVCA